MKKNEIISPMTVPEGPKPIYTIYSGIPANNQLNENRSRIHQEYGAPQQGMIRVSSHVNHSISATPSVIRGSYSHLTSKPEGGFSLPPTNYNLSANTYIHHK